MKTALQKLRAQLDTIEAFATAYNVGDRGYIGCLSHIWPTTPEVTFTLDDMGWVLATFGGEQWTRRADLLYKIVDGVKVCISRDVQPEEEAGISLPAEWVRPLHPATEPHNVASDLMLAQHS